MEERRKNRENNNNSLDPGLARAALARTNLIVSTRTLNSLKADYRASSLARSVSFVSRLLVRPASLALAGPGRKQWLRILVVARLAATTTPTTKRREI